jgi:drug/metabolite transporter (DMT)-like permease
MKIPWWFVFALLAALFSGLNNFLNKVAAEKKFNSKIVAFWFNLFSMVIAFLGFLFYAKEGIKIDLVFWGGIIIVAIGNIVVILNKIKGLKYLNAGTFFVASRFGLIGILFLVEFFWYNSLFTMKSVMGLVIGFIALGLLAETKKNKKKQYLIGGAVAVVIVIITMTINNVVRKNVILMDYDRYAYYFFMFGLSFLFTTIINYKELKSKVIFTNKNKIIFYPFLQAVFNYGTGLAVFASLEYGANLAILSKTVSYSLFVPIILSIIIYKEKVTIKKLVAFGLTVVSLWLFL